MSGKSDQRYLGSGKSDDQRYLGSGKSDQG